MLLVEVIKVREQSEEARAKTLYWLRNHLQSLGSEAQVRVVRELIGDLRKSLREYERVKDKNLVQIQHMPVKAIEHRKAVKPLR
jgi:hypothetical protein